MKTTSMANSMQAIYRMRAGLKLPVGAPLPQASKKNATTNRFGLPGLRRGIALAAIGFLLAGCATVPQGDAASGDAYDVLYSGKSKIAYATAFPVASAGEATKKGDVALAGGDTDRALFEYVRALKKGGENAEVLFKIGSVHAARANEQLAELAFRWALKEDPRHAGALEGLGIQLMNKRQYAEAETRLRAAARSNPRLPRTHNALGVLEDMQRNYAQAQGHYQDALGIVPKSPTIYNNLGYSRYLSGNYKSAISAFEKSVELDPGYKRAWRNLGLVYARQRRYDRALEALGKVEDAAKAHNDVGYVAMLSGRLNEAESFFDEAMYLSPQYYETASVNAQRVQTLKGSRQIAQR